MVRFSFLLTWLLLASLWSSPDARAQGMAEVGALPTRIFQAAQYNAHSQNFALTQDQRGVLYAGNFAGVLEYDGLSWRTIPTANITKVSALLTGTDGMVYVGANGEFGVLRPDSAGTLRFRSLSTTIKTRFDETLAVLETQDGVYFVTRHVVFRWNGRTVREWTSPAGNTAAFVVGRTLYAFQAGQGLSTFQQGTWRPVGRQVGLPPLYDVVALLPQVGNSALVVTSSQGLFQLENNTLRAVAGAASDLLKKSEASSANRLPDHTVVVGTHRQGLVLLDANGSLLRQLHTGAGLRDQVINASFVDREGSLWLALNNGLAQVEVASPLTLFNESTRLIGDIADIKRVGGTLYLAAANGLFRLVPGEATLRPVPGLGSACFGLAEQGGVLYVATSKGLYEVTGGTARALTEDYTLCVSASHITPGQVYVGTQSGVARLTLRAGQPAAYQLLPGLTERIFGITEAPDGTVWLETLTAGLYRLPLGQEQISRYGPQQGLPTLLYNQVAATSQGVLAYNEKGIFRFDKRRNGFVAHNPFGRHTVTENWKNTLLEDAAGDIWTVEGDKKTVTQYRKTPTGFVVVRTPFLPVATAIINVVYPEPGGIVWLGGRDGVTRYDPAVPKAYAQPYLTLLRQVATAGEKNLFNGSGAPVRAVSLAADANDIYFEFGAATYPVTSVLTFQYLLENYDRTWSDWSVNNKKDYTNLPPGHYRFRVRARNVYATPGTKATFAFDVLAPWYARWWAIALFVAMGGLALAWLVRWRLAAVVREKQALETLIQERTEEVVNQKAELEKQSEELAVKNDQLEKIDLIVQSINAEIAFDGLFPMILAKFSVIRNMNQASFLIYDPATDTFRFKALRGPHDLAHVQEAGLTLQQAESRYLAGAVETNKDIYLKSQVEFAPLNNSIDDLVTPKSLITIVIETAGRIDGFITIENTARPDAFDAYDISLLSNLKEHLIAAFIKTQLLESLANTLHDLENTQGELIRQEKLASVGQLTKGIVDRILNPLNYVTNFSQVSDELITGVVEMLEQQQRVLPAEALEEMLEELDMVKGNSLKIQEHSYSTTRILKDMQKLLKDKSRDFVETDLNGFLSIKARAVLKEMDAEYPGLLVSLVLDLAALPVSVRLLPYEFGQVVHNLLVNACYTLAEKNKTAQGFAPEIIISTRLTGGQAVVQLRDNGKGIPARELVKLFSPFFTTKPTSKGSGLGLYMSKDIVETHKGKIEINSHEGEFTEITMTLPAA